MNSVVVWITAGLAVAGFVLWFVAWSRAASEDGKTVNRAQVLGGLAGGILTGAVVTFGLLLLQQWLAASSENALWRASVGTAANIPGFTPGNRSMQGMNLSGKQLRDADLRQKNLTGVEFRDTNLTGSDLVGANFHGDTMYSANLSYTDLTGADLSGAEIQGVQFVGAHIADIKSLKGATVDAATCWPPRFLKHAIDKGVRVVDYHDNRGNVIKSPGHEYPYCLKSP